MVFLELDLDQALREASRIDGRPHLLQQVRETANVILVTMCDDNCPNPVQAVKYVAHVGDDDVDAQHVAFGEH